LVGVLHLLDRLLALLLGELGEAPVVEHAVVQPILVDGAELVLERLVKDVDDVFPALHAASRARLTTGSACRDRAVARRLAETKARARAILVPTIPARAGPAGQERQGMGKGHPTG